MKFVSKSKNVMKDSIMLAIENDATLIVRDPLRKSLAIEAYEAIEKELGASLPDLVVATVSEMKKIEFTQNGLNEKPIVVESVDLIISDYLGGGTPKIVAATYTKPRIVDKLNNWLKGKEVGDGKWSHTDF